MKYEPVLDDLPIGPMPIPITYSRGDGFIASIMTILGAEFWEHQRDPRLQEWYREARKYLEEK